MEEPELPMNRNRSTNDGRRQRIFGSVRLFHWFGHLCALCDSAVMNLFAIKPPAA
jgi:hypothetical protein